MSHFFSFSPNMTLPCILLPSWIIVLWPSELNPCASINLENAIFDPGSRWFSLHQSSHASKRIRKLVRYPLNCSHRWEMNVLKLSESGLGLIDPLLSIPIIAHRLTKLLPGNSQPRLFVVIQIIGYSIEKYRHRIVRKTLRLGFDRITIPDIPKKLNLDLAG